MKSEEEIVNSKNPRTFVRGFLVGDGGYSAPLDFLTVPNGCEKSALLETSQSQKPIAAFGLLRLNHLRRFSSKTTHFCQTKKTPLKVSFLLGGSGWIRTTEVEDNRFTVCPLWPLGNTPILNSLLLLKLELVDGLEPPTC